MKLYGITGGIGMGKSASARFLSEWGIPVVDTDILARALVEPGEPALAEIVASFGSDLLDETGRLRRRALAAKVFASDEHRRRLESILHPRIRAAWKTDVEQWRRESRAAAVIIPLLFETEAQSEFDCIVCVACQSATQSRRLQERGWSSEEIERRLASQWSIQRKMDGAHRVVWTEPSLAQHAAQLARIVQVTLPSGAASTKSSSS
jgi:dephospho-CoA kinase